MLKHIGKMKQNGTKVCIVYRTLPGDAYSALVIGTSSLSDLYHNSLMSELESLQAQEANELGDHISNRYFPDGTNMLEQLHRTGKLVKVATDQVFMTPTASNEVSLDQLNVMIAEQRNIPLDELSIKPDSGQQQKKTNVQDVEVKDLTKVESKSDVKVYDLDKVDVKIPESASELRSEADRLYKEASKLRKAADELDPPKKKASSVKNTEEAPQ